MGRLEKATRNEKNCLKKVKNHLAYLVNKPCKKNIKLCEISKPKGKENKYITITSIV